MASVRKETAIAVPADVAWSALADWPAVHERLAPGFIVDSRVEGEDRIVTSFTGAVVRERIVTVDDEARRLAWSIVDGPYAHHHASAQVLSDGDDRCRFVWIADVLPHAAAEVTSELMQRGIGVIKATMEATPAEAAV